MEMCWSVEPVARTGINHRFLLASQETQRRIVAVLFPADVAERSPMPSPDSVSHWIEQLKAGNQAAAQELWERYFQRIVQLARKKLQGSPRRAADEEDVALSAFHSFCQGAEQGRFPRLQDRDDLWQLLVMLTARKGLDLLCHENRQKRGGGAGGAGRIHEDPALEDIIGREPSPDFAAQIVEECQWLMNRLDPDLRQVAAWKMEGYTNEEIAEKLSCVPRTVERRLLLIRTLWKRENPA